MQGSPQTQPDWRVKWLASLSLAEGKQKSVVPPAGRPPRAPHQSVWSVRLALLAQQEGGGKQGVALASAGPGHRRAA